MELFAAAAIAGTMFFLLLALGTGETSRVRSRLQGLRAEPLPTEGRPAPRSSMMQRLVGPMTRAPVEHLKRAMPTALLERFQAQLLLAGEPMTVNTFVLFQLMSAAVFLLMPGLLVFGARLASGPGALFFVALMAVVGLGLPHLWLRQRIGHRQAEIIKTLPDSFDLITTCVEAGLGLDAALTRVSEKIEGPFAIELRRALRDISLGRMRRDALRELGERTGVPDLLQFVNAVIQAEQMGSSVGAVLRVQSDQLRVRRRQRAEEQAYKAPVKMIFPLVLCIFPTLFIVILGPAAITIIQDFPGK